MIAADRIESNLEAYRQNSFVRTDLGWAVRADCRNVLRELPDACAKLIIFSPPFENSEEQRSEDSFWGCLVDVFSLLPRLLAASGSVVFELGQCWRSDAPARTTHGLSFVGDLLRRGPWHLLQEFYWHNPPELLGTPRSLLEQGIRFRDSVTPIYWLSTRADLSARADRARRYRGTTVPDPRDNLLTIGDGPDDARYLEKCEAQDVPGFIDRFPVGIPRFFIELLTERGELVVDPFAGSCTTGSAAQSAGRRWLCVELRETPLQSARFRF